MNYIVTKNKEFFEKIGEYNYCTKEEMVSKLGKGIAIDSETTGLYARTDVAFSWQIGTGKDNFLIDFQDYSGSIKFKEYEGRTQYAKDFLDVLEGKHLVFHNAIFDIGFLLMEGFVPDPDLIYDTMIQSRILYNGKVVLRHDFGSMMKRELDITYLKDEQKNIHRVRLSTPAAIHYCFNDVDKLLEAHRKMFRKLSKYGGNLTYDTNRKVLPVLAYIELCGMPVNEYKWRAKMEKDKTSLAISERTVIDYIYDNLPKFRDGQYSLFDNDKNISVSLSSPLQLFPVFEALGINIMADDKKNGGQKRSIDEKTIGSQSHEFIKIWLELKNFQHRVNNFGENILSKIDNGRLYPKFNPLVDTARISAKKDGDLNALNLPREDETRDCFEAAPGCDIIVCDYDGQENSNLADNSLDATMLAAVVEGLDLHCAFARMVFPELSGLDDETIAKHHKEKRTFVKSPRFAFAYGAGPYTVHKASGMPLAQAEDLHDKFHELHEGVFAWGTKVLEKAMVVGYIESVDHWRLHLPDFDRFQELKRKIDGVTREMWQTYKRGKTEYKTMKEWEELGKEYEIKDEDAWDLYEEWKTPVRKFFKMKGDYYRLCLNNPNQTAGAHQTKTALTWLFKHIIRRGHLWKCKIWNSPYDEIDLETQKDITEEYITVLGQIMRDSGNKYLTSGLLKMGATAKAGTTWMTAK